MKIKREYPTQKYLRSVLTYNKRTGIFRWKKHIRAPQGGTVAGTDDNGYVGIKIKNQRLPAHRLAWIYIKGRIPRGFEIDHKDLDRSNNRFKNLRPADSSQQVANSGIRADNSSGFKGVTFYKQTKRWRAQVGVRGKKISIGYFDTPDEAAAAYKTRAAQEFGSFYRSAAA